MGKYTTEQKLEIVKSVVDEGIDVCEASRRYQVDKSGIRKWVAAYREHGIKGIDGHYSKYSGEFKQEVVEYLRENKLSFREAAAKFNIGSHDVIVKWERIYIEEGPESLYIERRGGTNDKNKKWKDINLSETCQQDLITENQRLRMENEYLKKLNALVQERERSERKKKPR